MTKQPRYRMDCLAQVFGVPPKTIYDWLRSSERKYLIPGTKGEGQFFPLWHMSLVAVFFILQGALPRAKREMILELLDQREFRKALVNTELNKGSGSPFYVAVDPKDHKPRWTLEPDPSCINVDLRLIMRHLKSRFRQIVKKQPDWVERVEPYYDSFVKGKYLER